MSIHTSNLGIQNVGFPVPISSRIFIYIYNNNMRVRGEAGCPRQRRLVGSGNQLVKFNYREGLGFLPLHPPSPSPNSRYLSDSSERESARKSDAGDRLRFHILHTHRGCFIHHPPSTIFMHADI